MTIATILAALESARSFIEGFEGDELQDGLPEELLVEIDAAKAAALALSAESTAAPTVENKRGAWFARLDAAQVTFDGFQAGVTTDPDEHGRRYISEPWNETDGSLCDLADWHHTADDAREAASAASFRFGHSGIFDNLIDDE